jgi:hypothetical protein
MRDKDIDEKFLSLAEPVLGQARSRAALAGWRQVAQAATLAPLIELLDLPR